MNSSSKFAEEISAYRLLARAIFNEAIEELARQYWLPTFQEQADMEQELQELRTKLTQLFTDLQKAQEENTFLLQELSRLGKELKEERENRPLISRPRATTENGIPID